MNLNSLPQNGAVKILKKGDLILYGTLLAVCLIFVGIKLYNRNYPVKFLEIKVDGELYKKMELKNTLDSILEVSSKEGKVSIEIRDGKARVVDSTCKDKLCEKMGWVSETGEVITCLPNRITVSIIGGSSDYDSTTY